MIHPRSAKGSKVIQLLAQDWVLALPDYKLGIGTGKELVRLQQIRYTGLPDDLNLPTPPLVHDDPTTGAERTEAIDGISPIDRLHEGDQHPRHGGERARAAEYLMIEEMADLVDDRELWVVPEAAEPETERLAGSVVPLVGTGLSRGARPHDRQQWQIAVAVDGVDGGQGSAHGIERSSR